MPYADFTPGDPIVSATVEGLFNDLDSRLLTVEGVAFSATVSSSSATSNPLAASGVATKVVADTEELDAGADYNTGTARWTPGVAGWFLVGGQVVMQDNLDAGEGLYGLVYKNGVLWRQFGKVVAPSTTTLAVSGMVPVQCNGTTDYVEMWAQQQNGATRRVAGGTANSVFFGYLISRT